MKIRLIVIFVGILILASLQPIKADVGVGISPSKMVERIEGGKQKTFEVLVFNTGSDPLSISVSVTGEIAEFFSIDRVTEVIDPEPKPHKLPIKNGRTFLVTFSPPATGGTKEYSGTISAIGSPAEGSQFGGSVGVATQVTIITTPTSTILSYLTTTHYIILGVVLLVILLILWLKKAGLSIGFKKGRRKK